MGQRMPHHAPRSLVTPGGHLVLVPPLAPLKAVGRFVPSARQRPAFSDKMSCIALSFAALLLVAAYVLVPLAMAVHVAMTAAALAWVIAAAVLVELFMLFAFIILKTEGQERGNAPANDLS